MSTKSAKRGHIEYGDVEISDAELSPHAVRRRISIMIPEAVLAHLRRMAEDEDIGYQTMINRILSDATKGEESITTRLERIEKAVTRVTR